jgi:uncharacterized protein (TIGR02646 family)
MIRLDRSRVKVPAKWPEQARKAFPDEALFQRRAAEFERLGIDDPVRRQGFRTFAPDCLPRKKGGCDFKAIWGRANRALAAMSHQKCAYCEHPLNAGRTAAVEHFRPKSLFPSLVYDWLNYFLACGGCNGAKADKWPANKGEYLRPDEGDPATAFVFREDGTVEAAVAGSAADWMIADLDLNREWLVALRARTIRERLEDLRDLLGAAEIPKEVREGLMQRQYERLESPELGYSAAVRQCFRRLWRGKAPAVSP